MDWVNQIIAPDHFEPLIFGAACFGIGILFERMRRRAMERIAWRVYHAGVHLPSWRRR